MPGLRSLRHVVCGLIMAVAGFGYAFGTSSERGLGKGIVESRGLASNVFNFANPAGALGDLDLGDTDAVTPMTRYVRARRGVPPYTYSSVVLNLSASPSTAVNASGVLVNASGGSPGSPVRLSVTAADSVGTNPNKVTQSFRVTVVAAGPYRFANSRLCDGENFRSYVDRMEIIGGKPPFTFDVTTVNAGGASRVTLEEVGLGFNPADGTVFGKPFLPGQVTFLCQCLDSTRFSAAGRTDAAATTQSYTFMVEDQATVASEIIVSKLRVSGGTAKPGKDSIQISGMINLRGKAASALAGQTVELRIGKYSSAGATLPVLDAKGKIKKTITGSGGTLSGSVTLKSFKLSISGENFASSGLFNTAGATQNLPVMLKIGDTIIGNDALSVKSKSSSKGFSLDYKSGTPSLPGTFFITKIAGSDLTGSNINGDKWKASFIAQPSTGKSFAGASSAVVSVGRNLDAKAFTVKESKGKVKGKGSGALNEMGSLSMDAKSGKGSLQTGKLASSLTDIALARNSAGGSSIFSMRINLLNGANTVYSGAGSIAIVPSKSTWKNPTK